MRYVKKLPTKPSIFLVQGSLIHKTIHKFQQKLIRFEQVLPEHVDCDLWAIFDELWQNASPQLQKLEISQSEKDACYDRCKQMLSNFANWFNENNQPVADLTEAKIWSKKLGLMGIVDTVYSTSHNPVVIDYKTSVRPEITEDIRRQAILYALLFEDKFQVLPRKILIHFLQSPGYPKAIKIDHADLDHGRQLIQAVRNSITSHDKADYPCTCGGYCQRDFIGG
jgi:CRISPR/Cas system-associated exonuclease Cas4 (RecB family)